MTLALVGVDSDWSDRNLILEPDRIAVVVRSELLKCILPNSAA